MSILPRVKASESSSSHKQPQTSPNGQGRRPKKPRQEAPEERPTHSLDAEQATLGAMLIEPTAAARAREMLGASDFHMELHKTLFGAFCGLLGAGQPLDLITVSEALREAGKLDETGGPEYLSNLIEACPGSGSIESYAARVKELAGRRGVIELARQIETLAKTAPTEELHRALANASETAARAVSTSRPRFALLSLAEVEEQHQRPEFIEGIAPSGCLFGLIGPFGCGKSFVAIDWALCAATGRPWHGRAVSGGPVVYITPEGTNAFGKRTRAWRSARGHAERPANFHLIAEAPLLMLPGDVEELLRAISALPAPPALVVIDTVARHMTGGDENSQKDMGLFIAGADRIRAKTGATVLLVHHTGKDGKMRGSTALPGALDAYAELQKTGEKSASLSCGKAKDAAPFETLGLVARVCELEELDANGNPLTSLVFDLDNNGPKAAELTPDAAEFLDVLTGFDCGLTYKNWEAEAEKRGLKTGSLYRHFKTFRDAGRIEKEGQNWRAKPGTFTPSPSPSNHLQTPSMKVPQGETTSPTFTPSPPSLEGEGEGEGEGVPRGEPSKARKASPAKRAKATAVYGQD